MKSFCFLLCISVTFLCTAQTWSWAKGASGSLQEGWTNCVDPAGNVITAGYFYGTAVFAPDTLISNGNSDAYITKYDANGNILWANSFGSNSDEVLYSIKADPQGNIIATGYYTSQSITVQGHYLPNLGNGRAIFIIKYDPSGNVIWARSVIGSATGERVDTDATGNIFVTGYFYDPTLEFGTITLNNTTSSSFNGNVFIVKLNSNGLEQWARCSTGNGNNDFPSHSCLSVDPVGNTYMTGHFNSPAITFGSFTLTNNPGSQNIFLVKYDSSGNVKWAVSSVVPDSSAALSNYCNADASGNVYITGYFTADSINFGGQLLSNYSNPADQTAFLAKYDSSGTVQWVRRGEGSGRGENVCSYPGGVYLLGGFTSTAIGFGSTTLSSPGAPDPMFMVNYDVSGNVIYATELSSGGDDAVAGAVDGACNLYITGDYIPDPFIIGTITLPHTGLENAFTAKLSMACTLPVNLQDFNTTSLDKAIKVYWKAAGETGNSNYRLERSLLPVSGFTAIKNFIAGDNSLSHEYNYLDNAVIANTIYYYRIAVMEDGLSKYYSQIKTGKIKASSTDEINYTNPVSGIAYFYFATSPGSVKICFTDMNGRIVLEKNNLASYNNTVQIDVSTLLPGSYFVRIFYKSNYYIKKLIRI